ncbi:MAG: hypothetical protein KJP16_15860, partial [Gammaproteobacteria bacterium]|nr:hypothetical protein [Gammaproteobacteria bacterium]
FFFSGLRVGLGSERPDLVVVTGRQVNKVTGFQNVDPVPQSFWNHNDVPGPKVDCEFLDRLFVYAPLANSSGCFG